MFNVNLLIFHFWECFLKCALRSIEISFLIRRTCRGLNLQNCLYKVHEFHFCVEMAHNAKTVKKALRARISSMKDLEDFTN